MTVIAFRTDATTVLERLVLYEIDEIEKARRSERRNYLVKSGTVTVMRQWLEARRKDRVEG